MFKELAYLKHDFAAWRVKSFKAWLYVMTEAGIWAVIFYRIRRTLRIVRFPVINIVIKIINFILFKFTEAFLGVTLRSETEIGPGLYIGHTGLIRIHPKVKIGKNLRIGQLITIGEKGEGHSSSVPIIGDDVYIGVGAKIFGGIRIGNNAKIGANAVVVKDVPDGATAVGVPARIIIKK